MVSRSNRQPVDKASPNDSFLSRLQLSSGNQTSTAPFNPTINISLATVSIVMYIYTGSDVPESPSVFAV